MTLIKSRTAKKAITTLLLVVGVAIGGAVTIILFPQPLFAHEFKHNSFNVYSNDPIDAAITSIIDDAAELVKASELYDPAYRYDLFLSYGSLYNRIDDAVLGNRQSARATDNNIVIKVKVDVPANSFSPTHYMRCEGDLTYLIAHEMIHCLQAHVYGKIRFNPLRPPEYWKLEGYPEYVARRTQRLSAGYDLRNEIKRYTYLAENAVDIWLPIEPTGCKAPGYYYKARLITEYLIDVKKRSYEEILGEDRDEDELWKEIIGWTNQTDRND